MTVKDVLDCNINGRLMEIGDTRELSKNEKPNEPFLIQLAKPNDGKIKIPKNILEINVEIRWDVFATFYSKISLYRI